MRGPRPSPRNLSSRDFLLVLGLLALVVLALFERWRLREQNYQPDVVYYSVLGDGFLHGDSLYTDMWERKPPATVLTYALAQRFMGFTRDSVLFLNMVATVMTLLAFFGVGWWALKDPVFGLWAAFFFTLIGGDFAMQASEPNVEYFMNLFVLLAFGLWSGLDARSTGTFRCWILGVLWAWVCAYKQIAIIGSILCAVVHVATAPGPLARRTAWKQVLWAGGAFTLVWASIFGYFAMTGQGRIFGMTFFEVNSSYAGNLLDNLVMGLRWEHLIPPFLSFLLPLMGLTLIGILLGLRSPQKRVPAMILAFVLSAWIEVCLPGKFFPHYYQLWIPALCLGGAYGLFRLSQIPSWRWRVPVLGLIVTLFLAAHERQWYVPSLEQVENSRGQSIEDRRSLVSAVDELLLPGETFFTWSLFPLFYLDCERRVPVPFSPYCLYLPPIKDIFIPKFINDMEGAKPELVIWDPSFTPEDQQTNGAFRYLEDHYVHFGRILDYGLFYRKNGRLEERLKAGPLRGRHPLSSGDGGLNRPSR